MKEFFKVRSNDKNINIFEIFVEFLVVSPTEVLVEIDKANILAIEEFSLTATTVTLEEI